MDSGSRYLGGVALWAVVAVLGFCASPASAFHTGFTGLTADTVSGCNMCHSGGFEPDVTLTGPTTVGPGDTNEYLLQVFDIGSQHSGGLDVGVTAGSLAVGGSASSSTQFLSGEITHTGAKASDGTKVTFSFLWTAPLFNGMATVRGWGNAVNGTGTNFGDAAAYATLDVQVGATLTPTLTPTVTPTPTPVEHDAVVRPHGPVSVSLGAMTASLSKSFSVIVRNADPMIVGPVTIQLTQSNDCPAGVAITQPDFNKTGQSSVVVAPGKMKAGKVKVTVAQAAFLGFNHLAPNRCTMTFAATHPLAPMNTDPSPTNNTVTVDLNVFDASDPEQGTGDESVVRSRRKAVVTIPKNKPSPQKRFVLGLTNADVPTETNSIALAIDLTACPWLTATIDADPGTAGLQSSVLVKGGKNVRGAVILLADPVQVDTPNQLAPLRCIAPVTATGPTDPDPVPSNNVTKLVIDVLDKND